MAEPVLIALDWGTTHVRAALLDADGRPVDQRQAASGVGRFSTAQFEEQFHSLLTDWPILPALAAGMVGSRHGWREAPYQTTPVPMSALATALTEFRIADRRIGIVPGVRQTEHEAFDVMRGEETQIAGFVTANPGFSGTLVLPGTHSKWARIVDGTLISFKTYMTGELYSALSQSTILRHSVEAVRDSALFGQAAREVCASHASSAGQLFPIRARALLDDHRADHAAMVLSAILIRQELLAAETDGWTLDDNVVIGDPWLTACYGRIAREMDHTWQQIDSDQVFWPAMVWLAREGGFFQ